jgi:hypothetical protein
MRGIFSGRHVCVILMRHGFEMVRQRGIHVVMQRTLSGSTITALGPYRRAAWTSSFLIRNVPQRACL